MEILVVEPGCKPAAMEIDGTIESMKQIVGGPIQAMYPSENVALVYNEDWNILHLIPNRGVLDDEGGFLDIVCGTFFLCGAPEDSNYYTSLSEAQLQRYTEVYAAPEVFLTLGGRIIILPTKEEAGNKSV